MRALMRALMFFAPSILPVVAGVLVFWACRGWHSEVLAAESDLVDRWWQGHVPEYGWSCGYLDAEGVAFGVWPGWEGETVWKACGPSCLAVGPAPWVVRIDILEVSEGQLVVTAQGEEVTAWSGCTLLDE